MKRTFTTLFAAIGACMLCTVGAKADVVSGTVAPETQLTPKPAFVINYTDKIALEGTSETGITKDELYSKVELKNGENDVPFVVNLIKNDETGAQIGIIVDDSYYFPSGASVVLKMPKLQYVGDGLSAQKEKQEFDFTIETYTTYENGDVISSSANKSIVVKSGNVLRPTSDFACKQLIVENGAGVVVDEGIEFSVADTAFYMNDMDDYRNIGYLVNKGSYTAVSNVFMRNISYYAFAEVSLPVEEISENDVTITNVDKSDVYYGGLFSGKPFVWDELLSNLWNNNRTYSYEDPLMVVDYSEDCIFRSKGAINNHLSYSFDVSPLQTAYYDYFNYVRAVNPYQAPIDWYSIFENKLTDAKSVVINNSYQYYLNNYYVYNTKSGLTSYDGPMVMGYLQPAMSNSGLWNNEEANVTIRKEDLTPYSEVVEKYKDVTPKYPYIRFYCNNTAGNDPKAVGNRSVVVAYFINHDEYSKKYHEKQFDATYESVLFFESNDVWATKFPYISLSRTEKGHDNQEYILSPYTFKEDALDANGDSICDVVFSVWAGLDMIDKDVEIGILDYYLPGITFEGIESTYEHNIAINLSQESTTTTQTVLDDGSWKTGKLAVWDYDAENNYVAQEDSKYYKFKMRFKKSREYVPPTDVKVVAVTSQPIVVVRGTTITVKELNNGDICNVYNMAGSCVLSAKANFSEESFDINNKGIFFVEIISNNSKFTKKVIIE